MDKTNKMHFNSLLFSGIIIFSAEGREGDEEAETRAWAGRSRGWCRSSATRP
jgi:hypothetical protein